MRATLRATQLVVIIIVIRNFITWPFSSTIRTNIIHAIEIGILIQTKNTFHNYLIFNYYFYSLFFLHISSI